MLRVFATPIAAYVLSSSLSASINASRSSPIGALSSFAIASRNRRLYDSHYRLSETDTIRERNDTHEASSKLCRDGQEFILEVLDHTLHAAVEDIKVRLVGKLQQVYMTISSHSSTSSASGSNLGRLCPLGEKQQP